MTNNVRFAFSGGDIIWAIYNYYWERQLKLVIAYTTFRATSRTRNTSNTLIGVSGGAGPSSLHTTLEGPTEYVDTRWMYDLHGFLHGIKWIMVTWTIFRNYLLEVGLTQNLETMALRTLTHWLILFYHVWGSAWIEIHCNSIWLRDRSHMSSHYIWGFSDHTTWLWRCLETAFGHFLLGSHNFMVTALGLCVKRPLV